MVSEWLVTERPNDWVIHWVTEWSVRVCVYQCMSECDWWTDGRTVTDWRTDGRTHGLTDGRADGQTDVTDGACECARARVCVSLWSYGLVRVSLSVREWVSVSLRASKWAGERVSEWISELALSWPQLSWFGVDLSQLDWVKDRAGESVKAKRDEK